MIQKQFKGTEIIVTDAGFGPVVPGDKTFLDRFQKHFSWRPENVVWMEQPHSANVQLVSRSRDKITVLKDTDGIITRDSGVMLITKTADCVPLLLWNHADQVIAALHCGWRGFFKGIIENFAETCLAHDWPLENFSVFLGPHLRVDDFEVQQDFVDHIPEEKKSFLYVDRSVKKYDISSGVVETLKSLGIKDIRDCGINTYNNPTTFSYRHWTHLPESERPEQYSTFANCILLTAHYD